jgi:hypothetical protein
VQTPRFTIGVFVTAADRYRPALDYIDSWVEPNFSRCFQLMERDDLRLVQEWVLQWRGAGVAFEIVPVVSSAQTHEIVAPHLAQVRPSWLLPNRLFNPIVRENARSALTAALDVEDGT